jgi:hypothetical protein
VSRIDLIGLALICELTVGVDRIPGHPASVDALVAMTDDVIATGSEDGMIRVMQILPNKFCESLQLRTRW